LLVSQFVEVKLNSSNIKHYEHLGYYIPRHRRSTKRSKTDLTVKQGTTIIVDVNDLPEGSHIVVDVQCDYCGELKSKPYFKYINQNNNGINKDCCSKCKGKKIEEIMMLNHGVKHNSNLDSFKENVSEKNRIDENEVKKIFDEIKYIMLSSYKGYSKPIEFICTKHKHLGIQTTTYAIVKHYNSGCKACRYEKISGKNYYNWKGGITKLSTHLRSKLEQWKIDSFNHYNSICFISGSKSNIILHHSHNFHKIVKETLSNLNLSVFEQISDYSVDELKMIEDECLRVHFLYGYGIPIREDLHILFHSIYGNVDNDDEQLYEFKERYLYGEFDNELRKGVV
jgi:hypothetical protein